MTSLRLSALAWLALAALGRRVVGLRRIRASVPPARGVRARASPAAIAAAVRAAVRATPLPLDCLDSALALRIVLARRGHPARLRFGVRPVGGGIAAHAWVECAGESLDAGHGGAGIFEPLEAAGGPAGAA